MLEQTPAHVQSAAVESRIEVLEQQVQQLLNRPEAPGTNRPSRRAERTTGPLPKQFVPLLTFAECHNVDMGGLPVKCGEWTDAKGTVITQAFDVKGRKAFYQLFRDLPHFMHCNQCPHGYLDTV